MSEPKKKRQYRKSTDPKPPILDSSPTPRTLKRTFDKVEADRKARVATGADVGAEVQERARRNKAERKALLSNAAAHEPVEKVLCNVCGVSYPETETSEYIDPDTGDLRVRCKDCTPKADAPQPASSEAPLARPAPSEDDDLDEVGRLESEVTRLAKENADLRYEAQTSKLLKGRIVDLERQLQHERDRVVEAREGVTEQIVSLEDAVLRIRDLEVLTGFHPLQSPETVASTAPWMLDLANRLISDAPEELDERALVMLLVDAMSISFSQRTLEAGRTMEAIVNSPAGEELLELEQAVRHISTAQRTIPDKPYDEKAEALTTAWINTNRAASAARTAVSAEIERLMTLHNTELHAPPYIPKSGEGRTFQVRKRQAAPPEPVPAPEPEPEYVPPPPAPDEEPAPSSWDDEDA